MAAAFVELQVDGHPVEALLDSGAARSAIVERPGLTRSVVGDPSVGVFGVHSDQQRALAAVRFAGQDLGSLEVEVVPADQATRPLVGQDVLSRFCCEYRLADGVLILDGDLPHDCGGRVPGNPTAIHTPDLTKVYGDHTALRGLSFDVAEASIFGLLGPNGAGKSTTIKILTTLSRATSGSATVAGIDVDTHPQEVRWRIGVVTQRPSTDPVATDRENLVLAARIHGLGSRAARHRTTELLDRFDLAEAAGRPVRTYSGGMQRKLDVAVGLVHTPRVLFLDEPTTGLDPQARAEMWAEIARLAAQERLSILLSTHYLEEADQLADQVAILDRGAIVAAGSPEQLKGQLHGDSVVTEVAADSDLATATATVGRLEPASDVTVEGRRVRVRVDD